MASEDSKGFPGVGRVLGSSSGEAAAGGRRSRDSTPIIVARYEVFHHQDEEGNALSSSSGTVSGGRFTASSIEGRTSTPSRLNRVLTPLKGRSRVVTLADVQRQGEEVQEAVEAAVARRIRRSRRKLRRWDNDRLVGVSQLSGVMDNDEEEDKSQPMYTIEWNSNFSKLMSEENKDLRDKFLQGYGGAMPQNGRHTISGRLPRNPKQDAEARFNRLEKRLRSVLTKAVGDSGMACFLEAMEGLLRSFNQGGGDDDKSMLDMDNLPPALVRYLGGPLSKQASSSSSSSSILVIPLRDSAFIRLLTHGCAQYYGLKSHSQDISPGIRAIFVQKPKDMMLKMSIIMPMLTFIKTERLNTHERQRMRGGRCLNEGVAVDVDAVELVLA